MAGNSTALSVPPAVGTVITVNSATDVNGNPTSTAADIATAMMAVPSVAAIVTATAQGAGTAVIGGLPLTSLDGGALTLSFIATTPGAAGNLPPNSPLALRTTFPGVSVSNPPFANGTWITSQGAEEQSDPLLKLADVSRWGTTGVGGNADAFTFWALAIPNGYTASPVAQVEIFANYAPNVVGNYAPGCATVVIIGPNGQLGPGDVAAVQANFEAPINSLANANIPGLNLLAKKYPINCLVFVITATNLTVTLTGTVSIYRASNAAISDVQGAVANAIAAYQQTLSIGEELYPVDKIQGVIGQAAPFQTAIARVDLSGMPASITPTRLQYPILDPSGLTYQLVNV